MSLLEEFALLAHDDRGARIIDTTRLDHGLGGAVLMELALNERIDIDDKEVVILNRDPTGDPVVDEALIKIGDDSRPRKASHWVSKFVSGIRKAVLDRLVAAEVLRAERSTVLLIFPRTRYPSAYGTEPPARSDALQRMRGAILRSGPVEPRTGALCALVASTGMDRKLFADLDRKQVKARLAEITEGDWAGEAVRKTIQIVQMAVTISVVADGGSGGGDGGGGGGGDGGGGGGGS
ncbi:GPP34 family phosphoprotein [Actinoplanes sp. NPDC024001]|uniref:GOLPH3/VPS74 family protein n=1 Tax=Actinoplanes sp. NPDC024001 TaxID=3154598 RepID=UPI0033DA9159